jgi:nucleotide-binding universal stress UspA family protein
MYKRILIATDGSSLSTKAANAGIKLAKSLGSKLFIFTAVTQYSVPYHEGETVLTLEEMGQIRAKLKHDAQMMLNKIQEACDQQGVSAVTIVGQDPIGAGIIKAAKKHDCGLIIMASHGRKGLARMLMGSETVDVLTHSDIPVLVLK